MSGDDDHVEVGSGGAGPSRHPGARIEVLDALRGFAVLGILPVNIWAMGYPDAWHNAAVGMRAEPAADYAAWLITAVLFQGRFIAIFATLFGVSLALFRSRSAQRGLDPARSHFRRMGTLFVLGVLHGSLLFWGDILAVYAVSGLIAWFVLEKDRPTQNAVMIGLGVVVAMIWALMVFGVTLIDVVQPGKLTTLYESDIERQVAVYRGGLWGQTGERARVFFSLLACYWPLVTIPTCIIWMVLGARMYEAGWLTGGATAAWLISRGLAWAAIGTLHTLGWWLVGWGGVLSPVLYDVTHAMLAIPLGTLAGYGYAAILVGMMQRGGGLARLLAQVLTPVGRLALTNYLLASLITWWVFGGHGLGLYAVMSRVEMMGLVLSIWVVQVVFSVLWIRAIGRGPVERVWRWAVYRRRRE